MITIKDEQYVFKYGLRRIEMIENAMSKSMMGTLVSGNGAASIADLRTMFVYGLKKEDGPYIGQKLGGEVFEELLNEKGYAHMLGMVLEALERDCPFFFLGD